MNNKTCLAQIYFFRNCSSSYGVPLWYMYKHDMYRKCVVAFNNIYHKRFKIQRGGHSFPASVNNNIYSLNVIIWKSVFTFQKKIVIF